MTTRLISNAGCSSNSRSRVEASPRLGISSSHMPPRAGALIAVILWGISFVATKAALREVSPVTLISLRFALGVLFLIAVLAVRGLPLLPSTKDWPSLALMGFVGVFVHQMLQAYALTMTTAMNTGWLIGLIPIWSALLAAFLLRERFGLTKLTGLLLGFAGAALVVTRGMISHDMLALPSTRGDLLILVSTVNWAIYTILGHGTIRKLGATRATAGAMFFGWLMLLPFFIARAGWREIPNFTATGWGALAFLGIGCSGVGYLFWYGAVEKIEASRVAAFLYVEPLVTFIAAVILLGERVTATAVVGGLLVLAGVLLMQRGFVRPSPGEPEVTTS